MVHCPSLVDLNKFFFSQQLAGCVDPGKLGCNGIQGKVVVLCCITADLDVEILQKVAGLSDTAKSQTQLLSKAQAVSTLAMAFHGTSYPASSLELGV